MLFSTKTSNNCVKKPVLNDEVMKTSSRYTCEEVMVLCEKKS